jgi:hypothetical protein
MIDRGGTKCHPPSSVHPFPEHSVDLLEHTNINSACFYSSWNVPAATDAALEDGIKSQVSRSSRYVTSSHILPGGRILDGLALCNQRLH